MSAYDVGGKAVLVRTGSDRHWRTDAYGDGHPFLTADAAEHLLAEGALLVGIDSLNIDDTDDAARPVHTTLLQAGVPICEHLHEPRRPTHCRPQPAPFWPPIGRADCGIQRVRKRSLNRPASAYTRPVSMAGGARVGARSALAYVTRLARMAYRLGFRRLRKISSRDTMFRWHERDHYFSVGRSARECIAASMLAAQKADAARILDFGCGYGRVLRVLREEFPGASITASDVDREAVDFCERTFGASGVYSSTDPGEIRFDDEFDLIWVGSVFTHLDETVWDGFLGVLTAALAADGLLIFTTEGPAIADKLRAGELDFGLEPDAVQSILRDFAESGFGYGDYPIRERHDHPSSGRYGVSVVHPDQVRTRVQAAGLEVAHYISTGWDNHQDVFACRLAAA